MNTSRCINLPENVWENFDHYATQTNSSPLRGNKFNRPSAAALLKRIGEDDRLMQSIANYLNQPKQQQSFNIETLVVRPINAIAETIARIMINGDVLSVVFPEKREDFKAIIKERLGYHWKNDCWQRTITPLNGSISERAAETGQQLLAAGFCVVFPNIAIQRDGIAGHFKPEIKRWVTRVTQKNQPYFSLQWPRCDDFYKQAMRMTGAKYHDGIITIPLEHFAEIEDFAALHGFSFYSAATELLLLAKTWRENAITVDVSAPVQHEQPNFERPVLTIPDDVAVVDELLDD